MRDSGHSRHAPLTAETLWGAFQIVVAERPDQVAHRAFVGGAEFTYAVFAVHVMVADGTLGWPPHAPYDAIMVTAGAPQVPRPLVEQLALGGRLVIPVGDRYSQNLTRIRRTYQGDLQTEYLGGCRFVKLIGEHGWKAEEPDY